MLTSFLPRWDTKGSGSVLDTNPIGPWYQKGIILYGSIDVGKTKMLNNLKEKVYNLLSIVFQVEEHEIDEALEFILKELP